MDAFTFMNLLTTVCLVASLALTLYSLRTVRKTTDVVRELAQQQALGFDGWITDKIRRWAAGEIPSRTEQSMVGKGTMVEVIEPLPGWKIVVGTVAQGKRVPLEPERPTDALYVSTRLH